MAKALLVIVDWDTMEVRTEKFSTAQGHLDPLLEAHKRRLDLEPDAQPRALVVIEDENASKLHSHIVMKALLYEGENKED